MINKALTLMFAFPPLVAAQGPSQSASRPYVIRAAHMIDGRSDVVQNDVAVIIEGERIVAVGPRSQIDPRIPAGAQVVDRAVRRFFPG